MKVTTKGQVTIPQEIRRKYGLEASAEVEFAEEDGKVLLRIARQSPSRVHALVGKGDVMMSTDEILALTREG
ncbi:MAG: AbrB/MazE/SpoVT family DNA-binding domain-containing protein [Spirochaetota bacterium]